MPRTCLTPLRYFLFWCTLLLLWLGVTIPLWAASAPPDAIQQTLLEAFTQGHEVQPLLRAWQHHAAASTPTPRRLAPTLASELHDRLQTLTQALAAVIQQPASASAQQVVEHTSQQVQAAHMLMTAHLQSVVQTLATATVPEALMTRQREVFQQYHTTMEHLLAPVQEVLAQVPATAADPAVPTALHVPLQRAAQETLERLLPRMTTTPQPVLRAQGLPVRPALGTPRPPRLTPTMQPSYLHPDVSQVPSTPVDRAASADAPLQDAILEQAAALGYDYVRIYEFVRNTIHTEWYAGAMHGAVGTLHQRRGNAIDQASLLIALFRASGLPARYVHGVIRLPIRQLMDAFGVTQETQAIQALQRAGLASQPVITGGQVSAVDVESTWVTAYVPATNYRGTLVDTSGPVWLPFFPALKTLSRTPATDVLSRMGQTVTSIVDTYLARPQTSDLRTFVEQAVTTFLQTQGSEATYAQQLGTQAIVPNTPGLLPASLPVAVVAVTAEAPALDDEHRQRVRLVARESVQSDAPILLDVTLPVSEIAGERVTLSYVPASVDEQHLVNLYGGLDYVPASLVTLRPQLKRQGDLVAVASAALPAGTPYRWEVHLLRPGEQETISHTLIAGAYHALDISTPGLHTLHPGDGADTETLAAAVLARLAQEYRTRWNQAEDAFASLLDVALVRPWPAVVMTSTAVRVATVLGQIHELAWDGVTIDAAFRSTTPLSRTAIPAPERDWLRLSALQGSTLEHQMLEELFLVDSMSADKGLQLARAQGIAVHRLTAQNLATLLPTLTHPPEVFHELGTWVGLGMTVEVPATPLRYRDWYGSVWRVDDPASGAGGYFITGGLAGGATSVHPTAWALTLLRDALASPNTAVATRNPRAAASVVKLLQTDGQIGVVGEVLTQPLAVLVRDHKGVPVHGAQVTFRVTAGGACVGTCPTIEQVVPTTALGIAAVPVRLGQSTAAQATYLRLHATDTELTQISRQFVEAEVVGATGATVRLDRPFVALAAPKPAARLHVTNVPLPVDLLRPGSTPHLPGVSSGGLTVVALDVYDNPVSNVPVQFHTPSTAPLAMTCPYVPTHFVGRQNAARCPVGIGAPLLGECGSTPYSDLTTWWGVDVNFLTALGTRIDIITVTSPGLPSLKFSYELFKACDAQEEYHLIPHLLVDSDGVHAHVALAGLQSPQPTRATLLYGSGKQGYRRVQSPQYVEAITTAGCASPQPMRYLGHGVYETFITPAPTPGQTDVRALTWTDAQRQRPLGRQLQSVVGVALQLTSLSAVGAPAEVSAGVVPLDAASRTAYDIDVGYRLEPATYRAATVDIDLFADNVWLGALTGSSRSGAGSGRLPRGALFDLSKTYSVELVINRGTPLELRSSRVPLPLRIPLILAATRQVRMSQEVDVVHDRSCVVNADVDFTLSEEAMVSLVFTDTEDPGRTVTLLDNVRFAAGPHRLPLYPDDMALLAAPSPRYGLPTGNYVFALTAVATGLPPVLPPVIPPVPPTSQCLQVSPPPHPPFPPPPPNRGAELGRAVVEYQTPALPVGHTLVKDVDVATGNLVLSRPDLHVPGRGVPLEVRRAYASNSSAVPGPLGIGWTHNYQARLLQTRCGDILITGSPGGVRFLPTRTPTGQLAWQPLKGSHATLLQDPLHDTFDFYSVDGTRYHFRSFGYEAMQQRAYELAWIADTNGNETRLTYDLSGLEQPTLLTATDPAGRTLVFTSEPRVFAQTPHQLPIAVMTKVVGPDGQTLHFSYDTAGHLRRVAREHNARVETYDYTPPLLQLRRPGVLASVTNPNGHTTTYTYDETFQSAAVDTTLIRPDSTTQTQTIALSIPYASIRSVTAPASGTTTFDYNFATRRTIVTNGRGAATTYTADADGAVIEIADPVGGISTTAWLPDTALPARRTNARGITTAYTYDRYGNFLSDTVDGVTASATYVLLGNGTIKNRSATQTDRNGHTTRLAYDGNGNLLEIRDPLGGRTTHTYASNGDRLSTTDPNGHITRYTYDRYGNVATVIDPLGGVTHTAWDVRSRARRMQDALGRTVLQDYDTLNHTVQRTDPVGNTRTWTYDAVGNRLSETDEAGRTTTFQYDAAHRLLAVTNALGDTRTMSYDTQGNLVSESDFRGNRTTYAYDAGDRRSRRVQPLQRRTTWTHDPVGNVLSETDALGRITQYTYDAFNRRLQTTDALDGITTMQYDGEGNVLVQTDANQHTTRMAYDALDRRIRRTDPLGAVTTFAYDANGNQTAETDALGHTRTRVYDALNRVIQRLDALGHGTTLEYDAVGNLTRQIDAKRQATTHVYDAVNRRLQTTDASGAITRWTYDAVGNRLTEHWANGNVITSTYNALNRLTQRTDALGTLLTATYDADNNRVTETDANGNLTTNTYDALNQLLRQDLPGDRTRTMVYDRVGLKIAETDPNEHTTTYVYDALHRLLQRTDPLGHTTTFTYDAMGNRLTDTNPRGHTTTFTYDANNRLRTTTDALGHVVATTYDAVGNKTTETNQRGIPTTWTYDNENRLLSTTTAGVTLRTLGYDAVGNLVADTDANGNTTTFVHDPRNLVTEESRPLAAITTYTYDAMGDRVRTRDPEGRTATFTFDLRRRLLTETNGAGDTTTYAYDAVGNRTSRQRPLGNTWTYAYDAAYRLIGVTDPVGAITTYTYDDTGNRLSHTDALGQTTTLRYDARNQLIAMHASDGATTTYTYDATGNRTTLTDPNGQTTRHSYDALNRLQRTTAAVPATPTGDDLQEISYAYDATHNLVHVSETYSGPTGLRLTTRTYDALDRLTSTTEPQGHTLTSTYDAQGNRLTLDASPGTVTRSTYDARNRLASVTTSHGVTAYHYDRSSRLLRTRYPHGTSSAHAYDAAGRLTRIAHTHQGTPVSTTTYAYDTNGNRLRQQDRQGSLDEVTTYTYDAADRLHTVVYPDVTTTYTYDAVGNRLTEQSVRHTDGQLVTDTAVTYNQRHQVTMVTDTADPTATRVYTYDANGNRIAETTASQTLTLLYDTRNQLRQRWADSTLRGDFLYDWHGLRVRKAALSETVRYIYDGQRLLLVTDDTDVLQQHYTWGAHRPLAMDDATDGPQYYLLDALGSVVGLSRPDGSLQSRTQYDAWGQLQTSTGSSTNRLGFTGYERDADSGLYYAKARYYDPALGGFLSVDPATADPMTPYSFHPYLYAYANPTVYIDPDGRASFSTMIDQAAEGCGLLGCAGWATLKGLYHVATLGFAAVHDPIQDAFHEERVTGDTYLDKGIGGGLVIASLNAATTVAGASLVQGVTAVGGRIAAGALVGATTAAVDDVLTQGIHIQARLREAFDVTQTGSSAAFGAVIGSVGAGVEAYAATRQALQTRAVAVPEARKPTAGPEVYEVVEHPVDISPARIEESPPPKTGEPLPFATSLKRVYRVGERMDNGKLTGDGPGAALKDGPDFLTSGSLERKSQETFFRTMSPSDYDHLLRTGHLPATAETFVSPTRGFSENYEGVLVQFNMQSGTLDALKSIGVRDASRITSSAHGNMPLVSKGWTAKNAFFKGEDSQINIGLGRGQALDTFNSFIQSFERLR